MTFTESEARTKWCPFSRIATGQNRAEFNPEDRLSGCKCIASDCAAWRWDKDLKDWGYCGLAGYPA